MAVKLHRCPALWVKTSHHPCWRVQKALDETGVEYEVVKAAWPRRSKRTAVIAGTGQSAVPALELEDGTWYRERLGGDGARDPRGAVRRRGLMRICSLLPSATEIVADLGLVDALVGRLGGVPVAPRGRREAGRDGAEAEPGRALERPDRRDRARVARATAARCTRSTRS